ncbi:MAG TPA: phosphoribosylglycinamide formyltransferase [Flavobacteriales bacterium]|nr:phosphoribosylglycinamide formyltransferase [Flavobacteriales bacterium]HCA83179.1 phosphoribosylglycinamide formyltransferase [Flavobacteriales bacterium]HRE75322.1 phosphoribosylglycinamide formyltransferase [Flavobacteriales bacterium]HRE95850.1 phosphoribosylglycinamide formyltransferase [Flavobacteriales bacterium]HRJ34629.1 phosphoribosylglycinamide formyltransferase [Flavobacteriales bacterium]
MKNLAIFASGTGSNAERLMSYFRDSGYAVVKLVVCNNPSAGVLEIARRNGVEVLLQDNSIFSGDGASLVDELKHRNIDLIVLAGFLRKIPVSLIHSFSDRIINIHPALLPKFGGKGMFGDNVHQAVLAAHEKETGITIHLVNEEYDKGRILFQGKCMLHENDTVADVRAKVHELEHRFFPEEVERYIKGI